MARSTIIRGHVLKILRDDRALTQKMLGQALDGMTDENISRIERKAEAGILTKHLPKLAEVLGMTFDELREKLVVRNTVESAVLSAATPSKAWAQEFGEWLTGQPREFITHVEDAVKRATDLLPLVSEGTGVVNRAGYTAYVRQGNAAAADGAGRGPRSVAAKQRTLKSAVAPDKAAVGTRADSERFAKKARRRSK